MKTGDILLIPFPFTEHSGAKKVRPSVLICETADVYRDLVVCAISSVIPSTLGNNEMLLQITPTNKLRKISVLKIDRIVTVKAKDVIVQLGALDSSHATVFREKFKALV